VSRGRLAWLPALACMAAIFIASSRESLPMPGFGYSDKVSHFLAYAVLGATLAFGGARNGVGRLLLAAAGSLYGVSDEVHQSFVAGRSTEFLDWVADTLGALAGVLATYPYFHRRARTGRGGAPPTAAGADTSGR